MLRVLNGALNALHGLLNQSYTAQGENCCDLHSSFSKQKIRECDWKAVKNLAAECPQMSKGRGGKTMGEGIQM